MSHFQQLCERVPALGECGVELPYLLLSTRIAGGLGTDADVTFEDDGTIGIAVTELNHDGRVPVCAAVFSPPDGVLVSWGATLSLAGPVANVGDCLSFLEQNLAPMKKVGS